MHQEKYKAKDNNVQKAFKQISTAYIIRCFGN
jgi:hypothetical protein